MASITPQQAIVNFNEAHQKLGEAETALTAATDQYMAAKNAKDVADENAANAVSAYNAAIDAAVAALTAAKRAPAAVPKAA